MRVVPVFRTRSFVDFLESVCIGRLASSFLHCKVSFRLYDFLGDLAKIFIRLNKLYFTKYNPRKGCRDIGSEIKLLDFNLLASLFPIDTRLSMFYCIQVFHRGIIPKLKNTLLQTKFQETVKKANFWVVL